MWHMDTKAHSLSMWMHNLDTLANLHKSGVCNPANLDKADTGGHDPFTKGQYQYATAAKLCHYHTYTLLLLSHGC